MGRFWVQIRKVEIGVERAKNKVVIIDTEVLPRLFVEKITNVMIF
jgi:hypothetical protein